MDVYFIIIYKNYDRIYFKIVYIEKNNTLDFIYFICCNNIHRYNIAYAIILNHVNFLYAQVCTLSFFIALFISAFFILITDSRKEKI